MKRLAKPTEVGELFAFLGLSLIHIFQIGLEQVGDIGKAPMA